MSSDDNIPTTKKMVTKKSAKTVKTSPGAEKVDLAGNETKLRDIVIDAVEYVSCDDVMKMAPVYAKGYRNTRELVKKRALHVTRLYMRGNVTESGRCLITSQ